MTRLYHRSKWIHAFFLPIFLQFWSILTDINVDSSASTLPSYRPTIKFAPCTDANWSAWDAFITIYLLAFTVYAQSPGSLIFGLSCRVWRLSPVFVYFEALFLFYRLVTGIWSVRHRSQAVPGKKPSFWHCFRVTAFSILAERRGNAISSSEIEQIRPASRPRSLGVRLFPQDETRHAIINTLLHEVEMSKHSELALFVIGNVMILQAWKLSVIKGAGSTKLIGITYFMLWAFIEMLQMTVAQNRMSAEEYRDALGLSQDWQQVFLTRGERRDIFEFVGSYRLKTHWLGLIAMLVHALLVQALIRALVGEHKLLWASGVSQALFAYPVGVLLVFVAGVVYSTPIIFYGCQLLLLSVWKRWKFDKILGPWWFEKYGFELENLWPAWFAVYGVIVLSIVYLYWDNPYRGIAQFSCSGTIKPSYFGWL